MDTFESGSEPYSRTLAEQCNRTRPANDHLLSHTDTVTQTPKPVQLIVKPQFSSHVLTPTLNMSNNNESFQVMSVFNIKTRHFSRCNSSYIGYLICVSCWVFEKVGSLVPLNEKLEEAGDDIPEIPLFGGPNVVGRSCVPVADKRLSRKHLSVNVNIDGSAEVCVVITFNRFSISHANSYCVYLWSLIIRICSCVLQ